MTQRRITKAIVFTRIRDFFTRRRVNNGKSTDR